MPDDSAVDPRLTIQQLLDRAGLNPLPDELDQLVEAYEANRADMGALYAIVPVRHEEPALVFDPRNAEVRAR